MLSLACAPPRAAVLLSASAERGLALQRDRGRGAYHLCAELEENDVIAFQTGTWLVEMLPPATFSTKHGIGTWMCYK